MFLLDFLCIRVGKLIAHKAVHDAQTTVIADVLPVKEASRILHITRQGVQNLMKAGKIAYVFLGNVRLPKRADVLKYAQKRA